jgi:hypothetical protein
LIIAPVRVYTGIRIITPVVSQTESKSGINVYPEGIRLVIIPVRIVKKRIIIIKNYV